MDIGPVKRVANVAGSVRKLLLTLISRPKRPGPSPLLSIVKLEMWYTNWAVI